MSRRHALSHLELLEAESIHIFREVAAEFENPVMLYSIGKDSSCLLRVAQKAFHPGPIPFPLLHIDTTMKPKAMTDFRDSYPASIGASVKVFSNFDALEKHGRGNLLADSKKWTDLMKTEALVRSLKDGGYDAAFGGARRDEEKSRAKERVYSFRDRFQQWDPKNQRPELWNLYNSRHNTGESIRVFPLSNWTEADVWNYIRHEGIPIVPLYYAAERPVVNRGGLWLLADEKLDLEADEKIENRMVRFRTLGCQHTTGAIESTADNLDEIILEVNAARVSERTGRAIDHDQEGSMEKKKREGYF